MNKKIKLFLKMYFIITDKYHEIDSVLEFCYTIFILFYNLVNHCEL
jgi:hypothetical protein